MGAGKSMNVEPTDLDKYATTSYYLGGGGFGRVYGPIRWHGSQQLAIKQVMFTDGKVTNHFKKRLEEKNVMWTSLEHKNLVSIHQVDLTGLPKVMFIVMDFAAGGSLNKTLRSLGLGRKLSIAIVTNWAKQITDGMFYLHEKDIVHRDLKSSNILLMEPFDAGGTHTVFTLKIADFDDIKEHDHTATMSTLVGTGAYMAPEVLEYQWFSKASDVWSFGVVIWEMLSGDIPHKGLDANAMIYKSINGKLDNLPLELSYPEDYKLLLDRCWESTYTDRIQFEDISTILQRIRLTEKYKSDSVLIGTIRTEAVKEGNKIIRGLTILGKELFFVRESSSQIEVYDLIKLVFSRRFNLKELHNPIDIASCSINICLYIVDDRKSNEILRVDPSGNIIKKWPTGGDKGWGLSVTYKSNVILTLGWRNKLNEYSPDGELIREINLSDAGIGFPWHAIMLPNGHFLVSHGNRDDYLHRVRIVNANGKLMKSFGGMRGSNNGQLNEPVYLFVDGDGFVLVADHGNNRVLLLDSNLEFEKEILTKGKHGLRYPRRIVLDESTNQMLVAEWSDGGLIKFFQF